MNAKNGPRQQLHAGHIQHLDVAARAGGAEVQHLAAIAETALLRDERGASCWGSWPDQSTSCGLPRWPWRDGLAAGGRTPDVNQRSTPSRRR